MGNSLVVTTPAKKAVKLGNSLLANGLVVAVVSWIHSIF